MCLCVIERGSEGERVCVCVKEREMRKSGRNSVSVCLRVREREAGLSIVFSSRNCVVAVSSKATSKS